VIVSVSLYLVCFFLFAVRKFVGKNFEFCLSNYMYTVEDK
jgi:hypothetical protein